jgi:hypothetical protein
MTVAMAVAVTPTIIEVRKASRIVWSLRSSPYHSVEKPVQTWVLRLELNEKNTSTSMGA